MASSELNDAAGSTEARPTESLEHLLGTILGLPASADGPAASGSQDPDSAAAHVGTGSGSSAGTILASPSWTPSTDDASAPSASGPAPVPPTGVPPVEVTPRPSATFPPTPTMDPFAAAGRPIRFYAPSIGVDAYVEAVGLTSDRSMDVPRQWMNVGWYSAGAYPGETGNSVIAGHLDSSTGGPAVFWDLDKLQPGDEVTVTYENGDQYTFRVTGSQTYPHDAEGPMVASIFGDSLTQDLNLITCDGAWQHGQATYSHRLVVFTTLDPDKTVKLDSGAGPIQ